jgi:hypothetical protein
LIIYDYNNCNASVCLFYDRFCDTIGSGLQFVRCLISERLYLAWYLLRSAFRSDHDLEAAPASPHLIPSTRQRGPLAT